MMSSPTSIFMRCSTDFGINFEMGKLEKIHTGEFKFKGGAGHFSCPQEFLFSRCLNVSVWYQKQKCVVLQRSLLCENKHKVFNYLNELNDWSAW